MVFMTNTTAPISTNYRTGEELNNFETDAYTVQIINARTYTVSFDDADAAIAAVEAAKIAAVAEYIRNGGNPRNRRGYGSQFAAVKRAILAA